MADPSAPPGAPGKQDGRVVAASRSPGRKRGGDRGRAARKRRRVAEREARWLAELGKARRIRQEINRATDDRRQLWKDGADPARQSRPEIVGRHDAVEARTGELRAAYAAKLRLRGETLGRPHPTLEDVIGAVHVLRTLRGEERI